MTDKHTLILKFEDSENSFTNTNGLSIEQIAKISLAFAKAVGSNGKNRKITLSEVRGNCYALAFSAGFPIDQETENLFKKIDKGDDLNKNQKEFFSTLNNIMSDENCKLSVYNDKGDFRLDFDKIELTFVPEYYFEIDNFYGKITLIGGKTLDGSAHIRLDSKNFSIEITEEQEKILKNLYKAAKLDCEVRMKIALDSKKVLKATLRSFEIVPQGNFLDNIDKLQKQYGDLFPEIPDGANWKKYFDKIN